MANLLANETSPYLLQHADNPVNWHPWDEPALEEARSSGKPILLSIGYSACHWCHVMAHESFEDPETAALMNRLFVNIKVDREERPDLDRIYQTAQQIFSGRPGGWPLTVFLAPDTHVPIFIGTYFPKSAAYGMPDFKEVLRRVETYFRSNGDEVASNGEKLRATLARLDGEDVAQVSGTEITPAPINAARQGLGNRFDAQFGGFGDGQKFPHPSNLDFLLTRWQESCRRGAEDAGARRIVELTLDRMALGGLFDHLGGGFFRYCVDRQWTIPHFEKMLYDNAALLATYSDAAAAFDDPLYRRTAAATADWLLRDMQAPDGGFYAAFDADSDGEEGKFYVFGRSELDAALETAELDAAVEAYGFESPPNFEDRAWHLQRHPAPEAARAEPPPALVQARRKLLALRNARIWPGRDDKRLVAWNGLAIGALARASRRLDRSDLCQAAAATVDFVRECLWLDGRLRASFQDGQARFPAYLDDYAFLASGLVELLQADFRAADLEFATGLADVLLQRFADPRGGFYFTADDHERLIHRPKPLADEALPSGNGVAALALNTLGHLLGRSDYLEAARGTVQAAWPLIGRYPEIHTTLLLAAERQFAPPELVILRGAAGEVSSWRAPRDREFAPRRLVFCIADDCGELPGLLATRAAVGPVTAYLCKGTECRAPIQDRAELEAALAEAQAQ